MIVSVYLNKKNEEALKYISGDNVSQKIAFLIESYLEQRM